MIPNLAGLIGMHELPKVHFSLELYQSLIDCKLHVRLKHLLKRLRYYKVQEWPKLVQFKLIEYT